MTNCNNPGFAFVINSLLKSNKNAKLLSKAKKEADVKIEDDDDKNKKVEHNPELVDEEGNIVQESDVEENEESGKKLKLKKVKLSKFNRNQIESIGRTKPSLEDRTRERKLASIATKGVVQLFNVVQEQKKQIKNKIEEDGSSMKKRAKILSKFNEEDLFKKVNEKNEESKVITKY